MGVGACLLSTDHTYKRDACPKSISATKKGHVFHMHMSHLHVCTNVTVYYTHVRHMYLYTCAYTCTCTCPRCMPRCVSIYMSHMHAPEKSPRTCPAHMSIQMPILIS